MADVASPSPPVNSPKAGLTLSPPTPGLSTTRSNRSGNLMLDTFLSPVGQNGSFEFDKVIKEGQVLKRTRRTKSWKPIWIVLRPNLLSIYRDKNETKLRHQVNLSDLTAVARQKDSKRKDRHIFALFSPSKNYHFQGLSDKEAQDWVDIIRREARFDEHEEEMYLASPGGATTSPYQGFERAIAASVSPGAEERSPGYASSSDADVLGPSYILPKTRDKVSATTNNTANSARNPSYADYSGADRGSMSDFSDTGPATRLSALSLATTDPRPSTSSARPVQLSASYNQTPTRPSMGNRNASQMSGFGLSAEEVRRAQNPQEEERVMYHGWMYFLKSKNRVRQWKKTWLVVRPKGLALYKSEEEYTALLVLPLSHIIDAVDIDPISKSKNFCMQIISEERNYRFCAMDEESLAKCLGALKSLVSKRNARRKEKETEGVAPVTV